MGNKIYLLGGLAVIEMRKEDPSIPQKLTFNKYQYDVGGTRPVVCYHHEFDGQVHRYYVPRFFPFLEGYPGEIVDRSSLGRKQAVLKLIRRLGWVGSPQQEEFVKEIHSAILRNGLGGYGIAGCGRGKTLMGLEIARRLGRSTLIIVSQLSHLEQWGRELTTSFRYEDGGAVLSGLIWGKRFDGGEFPFVGTTSQTLVNIKDPEQVRTLSEFGTVIFDESQHLPADTFYSDILPKLSSRFILGLTAELYRSDGLSRMFQYLLGDVLYTMPQESLQAGEVHRIRSSIPVNFRCYGGVPPKRAVVAKSLMRMNFRNQKVAEAVVKLVRMGRQIFVFSELKDHLSILAEMCDNICGGTLQHGFFIGGRSFDDLDVALRSQVTFATYRKGSEGVDAPWKDCLVCATPPPKNIKQLYGRISRVHQDKKTPLVVDIVDWGDYFQRIADSRLTFWQKENLEIKEFVW
ncbi:MAG: DEAD/DEAH box helicase family protein [Nitrospira sp.]|nr:DEAD/DEAH box helicase family protein [Nitrospira sp.]